jgi:hypothetical protein
VDDWLLVNHGYGVGGAIFHTHAAAGAAFLIDDGDAPIVQNDDLLISCSKLIKMSGACL